ncbi:MAG: aminotransferase [Gammaproteobacteria bacterium]|nr:aminotransferase [Gammaproteobacteria bacterium]|tara:strand:- start:118932 stop:120149 length:1218 start_codon:yes stop_codon:yes gene_type:complete
MNTIKQSDKLQHVCYEIRGPALKAARHLEEEGHKITKLNIGNPGAFDFDAPDEILQDVIHNLSEAEPYSDSKGLFSARKAVMHETQRLGIKGVEIDDIYLGNGVSELIVMAMQALLNNGDEVLIPAPDYPLWTAAVSLSGGRPVHYRCDEEADWFPDINDIKNKISDRTRALVLINPNNPTGAVYSKELLEEIIKLAREHELILYADEIYDKILYDDAKHVPLASLCDDLLILTFNGLSKTYRLAGFRSGWMYISGDKSQARDYIEGLEVLTNMRLCSNVPAQLAIQTALGGYQSINELIIPGGRLRDQRDLAHRMLNDIPGVSCTLPKGAIYLFPKLDPKKFKISNDEKLILELLLQEKVLMVQGSGFNIPDQQHFRIVFLPREDVLEDALEKLARFLDKYSQS